MEIAEAIHVLAVARLTREQRAAVKVLATFARKKGDLAGVLLLKFNEVETAFADYKRVVPPPSLPLLAQGSEEEPPHDKA